MNAAQITAITLMGLSLIIGAYTHGKPKEGKNSFLVSLIGVAIQLGLYFWLGAF